MDENFQERSIVDRQGALVVRPSRMSVEYKHPQMRTSPIQAIIDRPSWEKPIPDRRGYSSSRDGSGPHRHKDGRKDLDAGEGRDWFGGMRISKERGSSGYNDGAVDILMGKPNLSDRRSPREVNDRYDLFHRPSSTEPNHRGDQGNQLSTNGNSSGENKRRQKPTRSPPPNDDSQKLGPNRRERREAERNRNQEENGPPQPSTSLAPPAAALSNSHQFMLILTGIPGSGKSTFAEALVRGKPDAYVRVNQDSLGSRPLCEVLTKRVLEEGMCPIIDRCNFDPSQRAKFLNIAKSFGIPSDCVVFKFPMDVCIQRCCERRRHETVNAENAAQIVRTMVRQFSPPLANHKNSEAFRSIKVVDSRSAFQDLVQDYLNIIP